MVRIEGLGSNAVEANRKMRQFKWRILLQFVDPHRMRPPMNLKASIVRKRLRAEFTLELAGILVDQLDMRVQDAFR